MATTAQIRSTIESYAKTMTAGDKESWLALFSPSATVEDPVGSDVRSGLDGIGEFWDFVRSLTPEIDLDITGPVKIVGHEAAWAFTIIAGTGDAKLKVDIVDVMTFDDEGRVLTMRAFWDLADSEPA